MERERGDRGASPEQFNALAIFASTQVKMSKFAGNLPVIWERGRKRQQFIFTQSRHFLFFIVGF